MRHRNTISTSCVSFRRGRLVKKPYQSQYTNSYNRTKFAYANSKKCYIQILQYIADHNGCTRFEIQHHVWKFTPVYGLIAHDLRGYGSSIFSQLLYIDVIDYDKNFCYHITDKGRAVLKTAYLNDIEKFVKGK